MRRLVSGIDPGFLVVLLICLLAVWPFASRASLPEGTDAELHIFRLHELSTLVRGGEFYPRWAPDFYHGYGYPLFNYYAPLTYYLALPLELLPRVDAVGASKAVLVGGLMLGGLGLYGFVRDTWGRRAGYVAAALYVYAPYLHYIDPHIRGALPEAFSFAVFPPALWALDRLRRRPSAGSWLAAVALTAAVILSHNLMGLFFFALLAAWALWQLVAGRGLPFSVRRHPHPPEVIGGKPAADVGRPPAGDRGDRVANGIWPATAARHALLFSALGLGLALAAFFWLPVVLERHAVNLNTLIGAGDNYDFRTHFLGPGELLGFSLRPDWGATQSPFLFNLGVAQWLGGLLGGVMLVLRRVRAPRQALFFALTAAGVLFLMTPLSRSIWEAIPFLPYFQFPWRLLGAAAALLAILGAAGVEAVSSLAGNLTSERPGAGRWAAAGGDLPSLVSRLSYPLAVALPLLLALPLSQPTPWAPFGPVNTARMSQIENSGRWLGTTSTADYVPATVEMLPPRRAQMVDPLAQNLPPDRVNHEAMPAGATVRTEAVRPLLTRYYVNAPKQFRLRLYQFDFPGWQVRLDGRPATTELARPEGLIVVLVPPGEHLVEVRFGSTPARTAGWVLSIAALLLGLAEAVWLRGKATEPLAIDRGSLRADWPVAAVTGLIIFGSIALQPLGLFHHESQGLALDLPATAHLANFGDQIALLGYNASPTPAAPGDTLDLTLYWKALRPLDIEYQVFVHLLDGNGIPVVQSDKLNPGEFPTHRWPVDKYVPDTHHLALPDDLPSGVYTLAVGLWVQSEGWRLPVVDANGMAVADRTNLFTVEVR